MNKNHFDATPVEGVRPRYLIRMMSAALADGDAGLYRSKFESGLKIRRALGIIVAALGVVIITTLLASCSGSDAKAPVESESAPPEVPVLRIGQRPLATRYEFTGHTAPSHTIEIRARVGGYVVNVPYEEGKLVEAGTLLFEIDPRPYLAAHAEAQAEVKRSEASLRLARLELERATRLDGTNAIARQELEKRRADAETAEAELAAAHARLDAAALDVEFTKVRAPVAGRVSRSMVRPGNLISGGSNNSSHLATLVVSSPLHALFHIDEPAYQKLAATQASAGTLRAEVVTGSDDTVTSGTLNYIAPLLDSRTGTALARVILPNLDNSLAPGMFARVHITADADEPRLVVPETAIGAMQDTRYVLVVGDRNTVEQRTIVVGARHGDERVVESGLKPGESIVVNGLQRIRPGMVVKPIENAIASN